jgi:hypothetical protein
LSQSYEITLKYAKIGKVKKKDQTGLYFGGNKLVPNKALSCSPVPTDLARNQIEMGDRNNAMSLRLLIVEGWKDR